MFRRHGCLVVLASALVTLPGAALAATPPDAGTTDAPDAMLGADLRPAERTFGAEPAPTQDRVFRAEPPLTATPRATCGPGSKPEPGMQGRVPPGADPAGYRCNITQIGQEGTAGGFKVERYTDKAGHDCAYYDTTLLFPTNAFSAVLSAQTSGTAVLDLSLIHI